jgi:hypothetical protein
MKSVRVMYTMHLSNRAELLCHFDLNHTIILSQPRIAILDDYQGVALMMGDWPRYETGPKLIPSTTKLS